MTKTEKTHIFEQYKSLAQQFCTYKKDGKSELAMQADSFARGLTALLPSINDRVKFDKIRREVFREHQMAEFFGVSECV